jgi:two-component system sensor histidine kinase LytS
MSIYLLITTLIKHVGLLVAGAFILLTISPVQRLNFNKDSRFHSLFLIFFFGLFGILGTYSGNAIFNSIANLRAMAVITAGLYGGPRVGLGAGLIAGAHRFIIDPWGFSALPCAIATIFEGVFSGHVHTRLKERSMDWRIAMVLAVIGEGIHMVFVLTLSRPYPDALALVQLISLPMIVGNAMGAGLFVHLINTVYAFREKRDSNQAQKIFAIAGDTVIHLRDGLNMDTALATARIIFEKLSVAAVAITDEAHVLAHVGQGDDHHLAGREIRTGATKKVIETGAPIFHKKRSRIQCNEPSCPFCSAIIVPLKKGGNIVGTLKFYGTRTNSLDRIQFEIARGLTGLFSIQIELEDIQIKDRLLAHAEIKHLQAQINPHFLFNSLNTIASFCRTRPGKARELILDLSLYMRKNLDSSRGFISLSDELEQITSYLAIEKARFGDRIRVNIDVAEGCGPWPIPPLIIQPLMENAIKHGIIIRENGGTVTLRIAQHLECLEILVEDDGVGIPQDKLSTFFQKKELESQHEGVGLRNSNHRLEQIYGPQYKMDIKSRPDQGTSITFRIPRPLNTVAGTSTTAQVVSTPKNNASA